MDNPAERIFGEHGAESGMDEPITYLQSLPSDELTCRPGWAIQEPETHSSTQASGLPPGEAEPGMPFPLWDRYYLRAFIGAGGMGKVFKAWDPRLRRMVALKFIHTDQESLLSRFRIEAQSQARVNHPNVVKVFEVGEVEGRTYLSMEFVEGKSLRDLAPDLSLEEKLDIMAQVAEGVHAAHRQNIVHRDLKPGNLLIQKRENDTWHAFVTDFGLAREGEGEDLTHTGAAMGTPAYMAPEQIRGDRRRISPATDVYSLGVTLYELLSGQYPFEADNPLDRMALALSRDPRPIGKVVSHLPKDLQTVVMKCLAPRPEDRYPSARALGEDLRRILDLEPIQAKAPSLASRFWLKLRKYPRLAFSFLLGFSLLGGLGIFGWNRSREQTLQARYAQRFLLEASETRALLRQALLLPLHDLAKEKDLARARLSSIGESAKDLGFPARAPALYAQGQILWALDEIQKALEHVQGAWEGGFRSPEVALSLVQLHETLYAQAIQNQALLQDSESRRTLMQGWSERYLKPAKRYREWIGAHVRDPLDGSREQLGMGHYERAAFLAQEAFSQRPGYFEAKQLEGEAHLLASLEAFQGGRMQQADEAAQRALEAFREGAAIARSSPSLLAGLSRAWSQRLRVSLRAQKDVAEQELRSAEAAQGAQQADPDHPATLLAMSHALVLSAERRYIWGIGGGEQLLSQALDYLERIGPNSPHTAEALDLRAQATWKLSQMEGIHGVDPRPRLKRCREGLEEGLKRFPGSVDLKANLAFTQMFWAFYANFLGDRPEESMLQALGLLDELLSQSPDSAFFAQELIEGYEALVRVRRERASPLGPELERGLRLAELLKSKRHQWPKLDCVLAGLLIYEGEERSKHGENPRPYWDQAESLLLDLEARGGRLESVLTTHLFLHVCQAEHGVRRGESVKVFMEKGRRLIRRLEAMKAELPHVWGYEAELELLPDGYPKRASSALQKALVCYPQWPFAQKLQQKLQVNTQAK